MMFRFPNFHQLTWIGFAFATLWVAFVLTSCSGTQLNPHAPLFKQIVRMRVGHKGLTHQVCAEKDWVGRCQKFDLLEYDLNSAAIRKGFVDFQFICLIANSRYKIDLDQPRFVRFKRIRKWFLAPEETVIEKELPYSNTQFLINAGTFCYSEKAYPDGLIK